MTLESGKSRMYKDFRVCLKLQPQLINKNIISNGNLNLENSMTSALKLSEQVDVSQMAEEESHASLTLWFVTSL